MDTAESSVAEVSDVGTAEMSSDTVDPPEEYVVPQPKEAHQPISKPCEKCSILSTKLTYYQKDNSRLKKEIRELKKPLPRVSIILRRACCKVGVSWR